MTLVPSYCAQCGAGLVDSMIEEQLRQVCPACGTVAYRNPLPVASALVMNEQREILLVKRGREPRLGEWCLPIGFAELGETIAEAALRELREEAGIDGRVVRLLDVSSEKSEHYGDLLTVTYEAERTGGVVRPGTDAEDAAYFPLDDLPPLAFASNLRAVAELRAGHRDEWAIRASFESLEAGAPAGMQSDAIVALVRDHAGEIADLWLADVRSNPTTPSYHDADPDQLREVVVASISHFGAWLSGARGEDEVRGFNRALGARRRAGGFALAELLSALTLLRKHIWDHAEASGVWQGPLEAYRVLELDRRLVLYFDRAMYQAVRGYLAGEE